jgi:hypothetical protein
MIAIAAAIVALACAAASARRMYYATHATAWHPSLLLEAIGTQPDHATVVRLRALAEKDANADWERDFFEALAKDDETIRTALINEQLTELDWRISKWASVPRICTRISTSFAFLLAALLFRSVLAETEDFSEATMFALVGQGLVIVFLGFAGTTFCIAANRMARTAAKERLKAADAVVERLESCVLSRG